MERSSKRSHSAAFEAGRDDSPQRPPPLILRTSSCASDSEGDARGSTAFRRPPRLSQLACSNSNRSRNSSPLIGPAVTKAARRGHRPPPIRTHGHSTDSETSNVEVHGPLPPPSGRKRSGASTWTITGVNHPDHIRANASRTTRAAHEMSEVLPRLYVGSVVAARSRAVLCSHGISHVLNCCTLPNAHENTPGGPKYLQLNLSDSASDLPRMHSAITEGVQFIHAALGSGGSVLVHCHRGISRSCTLVIAYMIWSNRDSLDAAFARVRKHRPVCDPNLNYLCSLKEWEQEVLRAAPPKPLPKAALLRTRSGGMRATRGGESRGNERSGALEGRCRRSLYPESGADPGSPMVAPRLSALSRLGCAARTASEAMAGDGTMLRRTPVGAAGGRGADEGAAATVAATVAAAMAAPASQAALQAAVDAARAAPATMPVAVTGAESTPAPAGSVSKTGQEAAAAAATSDCTGTSLRLDPDAPHRAGLSETNGTSSSQVLRPADEHASVPQLVSASSLGTSSSGTTGGGSATEAPAAHDAPPLASSMQGSSADAHALPSLNRSSATLSGDANRTHDSAEPNQAAPGALVSALPLPPTPRGPSASGAFANWPFPPRPSEPTPPSQPATLSTSAPPAAREVAVAAAPSCSSSSVSTLASSQLPTPCSSPPPTASTVQRPQLLHSSSLLSMQSLARGGMGGTAPPCKPPPFSKLRRSKSC
uniref:Protein-serine/threonine phosphatase n=1 Tax=Chrysotila carterae TaxID=13221 RepID=A0A7S4BLI3_CHRCT|mmetsp:Transcript_54968/g.119884  ORF Transcript_54968/g.119884 Transcript_54968/m.119884 type:complete len:710 (+) Transcript_54968:359-2488(+)